MRDAFSPQEYTSTLMASKHAAVGKHQTILLLLLAFSGRVTSPCIP
jgi:hypothetical protein